MPVSTITEFTEIDADRVDLVKTPANGFPFLMIKALGEDASKAVARGKRDETPDIENAETVLSLLGKLVASEASELAAGYTEEACDIKLLLEAISLMQWFKSNEQFAAECDAAEVKKSAGDDPAAIVAAVKRLTEIKEPTVADEAIKTDEVKPDEAKPDKSIVGDVTSEGDKPPVEDNAAKSVDEKIADALAKADESHEAALKELRDELAKVKATPLPGGPVVTAPPGVRAETARKELLAKAAHFDAMAEQSTEQDMKTHYRAQAAAAKAAASA